MNIQSALDKTLAGRSRDKVHVTLTYAQSLDGRIAGKDGHQLRLSGDESMLLTHWMRTRHDAILVGIGTALNDNPQLNARLLPTREDRRPHPLPRPVILDSDLRLQTNCKLLTNYAAQKGRQPWLFCRSDAKDSEFVARRAALEEAGARIFSIPRSGADQLSLPSVLKALQKEGITSLMVEGGQRIISSFLSASTALVDILIVTVAPLLVGHTGIEALTPYSMTPHLDHMCSQSFGRDTVMACKLPSSTRPSITIPKFTMMNQPRSPISINHGALLHQVILDNHIETLDKFLGF